MIATKENEITKTTAIASSDRGLESIITAAINKVNGSKENDLCKYLPSSVGGYIHHFTMRKMKTENPEELHSIIAKFIINADSPMKVAPKRRAPRGSRKRLGELNLSKNDFDRLLSIAQSTGDRDLINKLMPKKTLKTLKRDLINSIRKGEVNNDLWNYYVEAATGQQAASAQSTTSNRGSYPFLSENSLSKLLVK